MAQRISSARFVGRGAELAEFDRLVDRATAGAGCALMVAGEAGIGKSRLLAEFEARLRRINALVLMGECVEVAEGELAFAPIVSALRPVMAEGEAVRGLEPPLRSALAALWPNLGEAGGASREQLFEGIYQVLAGLAHDRMVSLIVEDIHWIDSSSRDVLGFLVRNARRDRLLLISTYRPDELHRGHPLKPFLAELERSGRAERIDLEPLGRSELADQLSAIAGLRPPEETINRIFIRCEGNPFFAEELLATADKGLPAELPGSLREALLLRVEQLTPGTQDVLRAAAVVGRSVDHRLLARVAAVAEEALPAALREATEHHVLVLTGHGTAYTFRHALLREAIYDDTFAGERLRLHRLIAETLAESPELGSEGAAAELAHHWHAAGELPTALRASLRAAAEAERMNAYNEAVGNLERALSIWDRVEAPEAIAEVELVELLLRCSELAELAGLPERALTLGERARDTVNADLEPLVAATAETRIGHALWAAGRGDDAIAHLAQASRLVPAEPPSIQRAEALAGEGRMLMLGSRGREAHGLLEEALELATRLSAPHVQASALSSLAVVYGLFGEWERAIASGRRALNIATECGLAFEIMRAYINGSQAIDDAGQMQEALELGLEGIEAARRLGVDRHSGDQLRVQAAWRLARMGRFGEAEQLIKPTMEAASAQFSVAAAKSISGHLAAERGDFDVAHELLYAAWGLMQRSGGFQLIGPATAWIASLHLWRGEADIALERAAEGLARAAEADPDLMYNAELYWLAVRIEADMVAERAGSEGQALRERADARASSVMADLDDAIAATPGDGAPPEVLAFQALARAELSRLRAENDPAPWRAAEQRFRSLDERYRVAYAQLRAAEALSLAGADPAVIEPPLRAAHQAAVVLGTPPFQAQIEAFALPRGIALGRPGSSKDRASVDGSPPAEAVLDLLTGTPRGPRPKRLLATVMFTDIVGSTALAAELGDRRWRELLDRHDALVRAHLTRHGGVPVQFIGDGTLSTFDGPGRAIECACALRAAVIGLGFEIRAGVHTGEIELRGDDIGGIAVHIGARVAALAGASEILVSQTVTDVVAGSGIRFKDRGLHQLKGVPGSWQLSAVAG